MDEGYMKAQSDNIPQIDAVTMFRFISKNPDFVGLEIKGYKILRSARESYGDNAVGFVQLKHDTVKRICTVKGKITPEHNVRNKAYSVVMEFNEEENEINFVKCEDCAAHLGGCKHAIAFLTWIHRRSEEPSPTAVTCYWKKSELSSIASSKKFILAKEIGTLDLEPMVAGDGTFLKNVVDNSISSERMNTQLTKYYREFDDTEQLSFHYLLNAYFDVENGREEDFLEFCQNFMKKDVCDKAAMKTFNQRDSPLWFELRYARITASKAYDVMHCKKTDGVLVEHILGAAKLKDTEAMKRGRMLEKLVLDKVQEKTGLHSTQCGLMLDPKYPFIGASPDGLTSEHVIEIKCPSTKNALKKYITSKNEISAKHLAQVQMQMHVYEREKCLFCVADSNFEETGEVNIIEIAHDINYCEDMIEMCKQFWINIIFPIVKKSFE